MGIYIYFCGLCGKNFLFIFFSVFFVCFPSMRRKDSCGKMKRFIYIYIDFCVFVVCIPPSFFSFLQRFNIYDLFPHGIDPRHIHQNGNVPALEILKQKNPKAGIQLAKVQDFLEDHPRTWFSRIMKNQFLWPFGRGTNRSLRGLTNHGD